MISAEVSLRAEQSTNVPASRPGTTRLASELAEDLRVARQGGQVHDQFRR